jgi:hypothetical protein
MLILRFSEMIKVNIGRMSFRTMKDVEMKKAFCSKTILHLRLFTRKLSDKYMLLAGLLACSPVNHLPITFMVTVVLLIVQE